MHDTWALRNNSGLSEELNLAVPKVLSRDSSPMPEQTQSRPISLSDRPRPTTERRSWHGGKVSDSLTAAELLNIDKFEREPNSSPNDTASSGEHRQKNNLIRKYVISKFKFLDIFNNLVAQWNQLSIHQLNQLLKLLADHFQSILYQSINQGMTRTNQTLKLRVVQDAYNCSGNYV